MSEEITTELVMECVEQVSDREVGRDTDIFSAGIDSLAVLRCRALLKEKTGVRVPAHAFFGGRTPEGIAEKIGADHDAHR